MHLASLYSTLERGRRRRRIGGRRTSDVKVACSFSNVTDFFIFVHVFSAIQHDRQITTDGEKKGSGEEGNGTRTRVGEGGTDLKNPFNLLSYKSPNPSLLTLISSRFR